MMKYERFEDLPVWKAAVEVAHKIYILTWQGARIFLMGKGKKAVRIFSRIILYP